MYYKGTGLHIEYNRFIERLTNFKSVIGFFLFLVETKKAK